MARIHIARHARSTLLGSTRKRQLEESFRRLRIESLDDLNTVDHRRLDYPRRQKLSHRIGGQRWIQTERAVRTEREARSPELKSAGGNPVMKDSEWAVWIQGQNHDLGLHESHRRSEAESQRLGGRGDRRQLLP
jgi:hypothetical protein